MAPRQGGGEVVEFGVGVAELVGANLRALGPLDDLLSAMLHHCLPDQVPQLGLSEEQGVILFEEVHHGDDEAAIA